MQKRTVQFWAQMREMPEAEVMRHIGEDRYQSIRAQDEHPFFIGLDVGYEGQSKGEVLGWGNRIKTWLQPVIQKLGRLLNGPGEVGLYENHPKKQGDARVRLGDVVSGFTALDPKDDLAHAYAVGYVADPRARTRIKAGELDACSVEGECLFETEKDGKGEWKVVDVGSVDGVALANSRFSKPGFAGAGIVAVIQELEKGDPRMDREEIRTAIRTQGLIAFFTADELRPLLAAQRPSTLFDRTILGTDPVVQQIRDEGISAQAVELNTLRTKNATLEGQIPTLRKQANKGAVVGMLAEKLADKNLKLSTPERELIQTKVLAQDFDADDEAKLKDQVIKAVDGEAQTLAQMRKLYGKDASVEGSPMEDENSGGGGEGGEGEDDPFLAANADKKKAA